jgi:Mg-chelatase subunit ChlD
MGTRTRFVVGPLAAAMALLCRLSAQDLPSRLELADKIRMVEEGGSSSRPFFRVQFNVVSQQGLPVSIAPPKDFTAAFEVAESEGAVHRPLSLRYHQESLTQSPSDVPSQRYALLLIDVSGSMLDSSGTGPEIAATKYEAAKTAARKFLAGFQPGQDHVAIVPFESHQVRERVMSAVFAEDIESAERQIDNLPAPQKHYNTGLYTAIDTALDVLAGIKRQNPATGTLLVALTDGQNQALKGDDPDLLAGSGGLEAVVDKTNAFGLQVMTIGFGDESIPLGQKGAIDSDALRRLAWPTASQFHAAQDVQSLGKLFGVARQLLVNRWQLTFTTDRKDRGELAGLDLQFQIRLRLGEQLLKSPWTAFKTPQMSAPPFEGKLDAAEREALTQLAAIVPVPQTASGGTVAFRRALIFTAFGGLLAFFWFAVPLVLWPSQPAKHPKQPRLPAPKLPVQNSLDAEVAPPPARLPNREQHSARRELGESQTQFQSQLPSPDRTLYDPLGQQTLVRQPGESLTTELQGKTEVRVTPALEQPLPTGPEATLILDRLPNPGPGQTQIQIVPLPQRGALDRTLFDPRGQRKAVPKPDDTIIDPRGEQTVILPPQDKPPTKA